MACEDGGPLDHSLVSALEARKRSAGLVRVLFGVLVSSRGAPLSARPEPEACAAWLDTLRAEFESRYSTGAYVGRTKTIGRGDSFAVKLSPRASPAGSPPSTTTNATATRRRGREGTGTRRSPWSWTRTTGTKTQTGDEARTGSKKPRRWFCESHPGSTLANVFRGRDVHARCVAALAVLLAAFVALLAACGGYGCLIR